MNIYKERKTKYLLISILILTFALCFAFAFSTPLQVKAESKAITSSNFLPQSDLESIELSSPIDVYSDEKVTAITQSNQKLLINVDGKWQDTDISFAAIKQINKLDDNTLIVSDNGSIYKIDISKPLNGYDITNARLTGGNYFDINENYLITAFSTTGLIYKRVNGQLVRYSTDSKDFIVEDSSPIAINGDNVFYFVNAGNVVKFEITTGKEDKEFLKGISPSQIIANKEFVYYINKADSSIYKVSAKGGEPIKLSVGTMDIGFDLGTIKNPTDISFRGENLLITDSNSIQEFKVDEDKLLFTGFAIAKNKTAYNRVLESASNIEKVNDTVAVLDDYKLTVYLENNKENKYARENYKNYLTSDLAIDEITPSNFTLGDGNALISYDDNDLNKFLALLDFSSVKDQDGKYFSTSDKITIETDNTVKDLCYQSGSYYLLCENKQAQQYVYKSNLVDDKLSFAKLTPNRLTSNFNALTVDVYGNIYLANNNSVYKLENSNGYKQLKSVVSLNGIDKLQTDLLGNLFVLANGKVYCFNNGAEYSIDNIKSFALDFVDDNVYFIKNDNEVIYSTTAMDNVSICDLNVPSDYTLTNPSGTYNASESLEFFTVQNDANAYVVNTKDGKFVFEKLTSYSGEYVKICAVEYMGSQRFLVLANQEDIVLVEVKHAKTLQKQKVTDTIKKAFVATDVHAYYLPIINANGDYVLTNVNKIRLNKTTEFNIKHKIEFLESEYYYAEFSFNGKTHSAYIPCSYTVEVLNENFAWDTYKIETVKQTSVYDNSDMQTVVANLENNTQVRLIEKGDTICKIAYKLTDGTYQIGYINTDKIIDNPSIAIRNILIIIAVTACVCGTLTYFLLRKKRQTK